MNAVLVLQNGQTFRGTAIGAQGTALGQVVFTTGMSAFEETLTDPGFAGQLVTQTYPLAAGCGITTEDMVSSRVWASGVIVREACQVPSNFRCQLNLDSFLKQQGVVGIQGIDTRSLTRLLRSHGTMNGAVTTEYDTMTPEQQKQLMEQIGAYSAKEAALAAVPAQSTEWNPGGSPHVALLDFGSPDIFVKALVQRGCHVTVLPGTQDLSGVQADGIVVGDGAGDPAWYSQVLPGLKALLDSGIPTLGIGLGHELIAMAAGGQVRQLLHGSHSANQPVHQCDSGRVYTTNRNHGFEVAADALPANSRMTYENMDGGCAGLEYNDHNGWKCASVQFRPRVDGGGRGTDLVYDQLIETIKGVH